MFFLVGGVTTLGLNPGLGSGQLGGQAPGFSTGLGAGSIFGSTSTGTTGTGLGTGEVTFPCPCLINTGNNVKIWGKKVFFSAL